MIDKKVIRAPSICCVLAGLLLGTTAVNGQESQLAQALQNGSFNLVFRYRYEQVDQDGIDKDANASTLKTRLTYRSADFHDFSLLLELDDLRPIGAETFNSTRNGRTTRPVVVDPKATDLNQAAISYTGFADTQITFGRQRIVRANQRFIGGVPWRQNEQTYDALTIGHAFSNSLQASYAYISNVNRIFGPDRGVPAGNLESDSHLVDVSYDFGTAASLSGYGYFLDFDNAPAISNQTMGLRLVGTLDIGENLTLPYTLGYARQDDYKDNPNDFDADYYLAEAGLGWSGYTVKLGYEVFEGNGIAGQAFQTPLGTNHAFQGWADKFLNTPPGGIEDSYLTITKRVGGVNLTATYHDFEADTGGDYGDEINLQATWAFSENYSLLIKYADYNTDGFATDTKKFWVMLTGSF